MKNFLVRVLALVLILAMLPVSAFASLENHNKADVNLVVSNDESNLYFPDIVKLNDGTLVACFYRNTQHAASDTALGTVYLTESRDHGYTWSEPWQVIDRTAQGLDSRDPNLAMLPDGTLILTYMYGGVYMLMSSDGGHTWGPTIELESEINNRGLSKRGNIVAINNDNILIPCYGQGDGTRTEPYDYSIANWHSDAVILHYQRSGNTWVKVDESLLGREIDETAVMYTGTGTMADNGVDFDGEVYCFSREDGTVRVSYDSADTWTVIAKEEPRQWEQPGTSTMMSLEQIIQPRAIKLNDECFFVTYASYGQLHYAYDKEVRPVFGKVFFPKEGWYATVSKLIYDELGPGVTDMADPATVLTDEGRLLTIYYNTSTKSISGTFHDLSDWLTVDDGALDSEGLIDKYFWEGSLSTGNEGQDPVAAGYIDPAVYFTGGEGTWLYTENGYEAQVSGAAFQTLGYLSGDYSCSLEFMLTGSGSVDRDEGVYIHPFQSSNNTYLDLRADGDPWHHCIRLTEDSGVQLIYGGNRQGDYGGVVAGYRSENSDDTLPRTLSTDTRYTFKMQKEADTIRIKVWEVGTEEPDWQAAYSDDSVDVEGESFAWRMWMGLDNRNDDDESFAVSDLKFWRTGQKRGLDNANFKEDDRWFFWAPTMSSSSSLVATFYDSTTKHWLYGTQPSSSIDNWTCGSNGAVSNSAGVYLASRANISGHYTGKVDFTLAGSETLTIYPVRTSSNPNRTSEYTVALSAGSGLRMFYGSTELTAAYTDDRVTSLQPGVAYTVKISKNYDYLFAKVWRVGTDEPLGWSAVWQDASIGNAANYREGCAVPYDHSMYGEGTGTSSGNYKPYQWNFYLVTSAAGTTISKMLFYKDVAISLNLTEATVNAGETPVNTELKVTCYPNIYAQLPKPSGVKYSTRTGKVKLNGLANSGTRINRVNLTGVAVGEDLITATLPGASTSAGDPVTATCAVTVRAPYNSAELVGSGTGVTTEVIYSQNFESMTVNENVTDVTSSSYTVADTNFNPMSDFFEYQPFYAMSHQAVMESGGNKYLAAFVASGSDHANIWLKSKEKIEGDYTFQADFYLPNNAAEFRVDLAARKEWVKPEGEACYVLQSALSSLERIQYSDYEFCFRNSIVRHRLHGTGIYMSNEYSDTGLGVWRTVKITKAGDTYYAKTWIKSDAEPDWEIIRIDPKILAAEQNLGGGYLSIVINTAYNNNGVYDASAAMLVDNILVTRTRDTANEVQVTWTNHDGTVLETDTVRKGTVPTYNGETPTKAADAQYTYTFSGWSPEVSAVTGNTTYVAQFTGTLKEYTVTWNVGGTKTTETYKYGETPVFTGSTDKAADAQYTYTFAGWDKEIVPVTGNVTYTAQYSTVTKQYTVRWIINGKTFTETYNYGDMPVCKEDTSKPDDADYTYTFTGWNKTVVKVTGNAIYTAQYSKAPIVSYTVKWVNHDGTVLETDTVKKGVVPTYDGATPTKAATAAATYTFSGWSPAVAAVTGNVTYTAQFTETAKQYTVTWIIDGKSYKETYNYGEMPVCKEDTSKADDAEYSYTFVGWNKTPVKVTGNAIYIAQYTTSPVEPEVSGTITHASRTLSLDGAIIINQYLYIDGFEGIDIEENGGVLFFKEAVTEEEATVENAVDNAKAFNQAGLTYDAAKNRYGQASHGIAAKEYGDTIYIRGYVMDNNGNYHYGELMEYGVRAYCEGRLEKSKDQQLKNVCIALLHYGAAAQEYFDYNLDNLANSGIAATYPNFAWDAALLTEVETPVTDIPASANAAVTNKSPSLDGAIIINFYSKVYNVTAEKVELLLWRDVEGTLTLDNVTEIKDTEYDASKDRYGAQSMGIFAKNYGQTVFACAKVTDKSGNVHYSEIIGYSPEAYAQSRLEKSSDEELKNVVKTMTIYGEQARIYFEN